MVNGYSLSISSFLFFPATLLYIDESLWFLKLYFVFICFGVVFFSFPSQVVSLSPKVLVWFLFEFISKYNLGYANNRLAFGLFWSTSSIQFSSAYISPLRSILVQFDLLRSTSVQLCAFSLLWSSRSILVHSGYFSQFSHVQSILCNLVYIGRIWPIQSTSIYSVQFSPYGPLRYIQST